MDNNPLVSVIMPAYNHQNYVQDAINSIINQTYQNIELIIIDDGSKDNTWQKINELKEKCEKRFTNIYFETKENEGTCKTINKMLSLSKGEYIYLIASDDIAKPDALEIELNFLLNNPEYSLAVGDSEFMDSNGKVCYKDKNGDLIYDIKKAKYKTVVQELGRKKPYFKEENFGTYSTLYIKNYIPNGYLIRKSIFDKTGFFTPEAPLEDWWLMLQISKYSKMKFVDKILFSYRWHGNNTMANIEKIIAITKKTFEYENKLLEKSYKENKLPENAKKIYLNGVCLKKIGIPYVFEIETIIKHPNKLKQIKLFNLNIFKYKKG